MASATAQASAGLATSAPTTSPALSPTTSSTALPAAALLPANAARRFGVAGTMANVSAAVAAGLPVGAYLNWSLAANPARPAGADFWQMIRLDENGIRLTDWDEIAAVVAAQPGSIWIVGNEPDVIVQDNVTAERYAEIYHQVYHFIKRRDPGAYLAIAGVAQPTPLRLAYLDRVLEHYQASHGEPMPIDLWTVHAFILREEAGSWGVGIPPGFNQTEGRLYEVADHGDLTIWQQNLVDFRAWMARRGYANRPLAVTEYGIIMPPDYGYPTETAARFMIDTLDFMGRAAGETGYPADGGRLVQWWFWYSVYDSEYHAPNLYDRASRDLTALGRVYAAYPRD